VAGAPRRPWLGLPRPIWLLGSVSLLTDAASEAIYPLLPFFLTQVLGAGAFSLGLIEGVAEATSGVLKIVSGRLSDRWNRRKVIVVAGYGLSSLARPFIGLATAWPAVFFLRFVDRIGKGVRSAPRDAMLAGLSDPSARGRVYGFHRAMDNAGAVIGPLAATLFLIAYPSQYRTLFALTAIPGAAAVLLLLRVPESAPDAFARPQAPATPAGVGPDGTSPTTSLAWGAMPPALGRFLVVLLIFTLGNSTDAFLLLRLTDVAGGPELIPGLWALLHVVKSSLSMVGGAMSDRLGRRSLIGGGWVVYAVVYAGFAFSDTMPALVTWFLIYGVYFGLVEGTERALVADLAPPALRGTAFGIYNAVTGVGALLASVVFGLIWTRFGVTAAFGSGAVLALLATVLLFLFVPASSHVTPRRGEEAPAQIVRDRML
jgi:MFS family permease